MDRGAWWATAHGVTKVGHNLVTNTFTYFLQYYLQAQCGRKLQDLFLLNMKLYTLEHHLANAPSAPGNHLFIVSTCWTITDPSYKQNYAMYLFCDGLVTQQNELSIFKKSQVKS